METVGGEGDGSVDVAVDEEQRAAGDGVADVETERDQFSSRQVLLA